MADRFSLAEEWEAPEVAFSDDDVFVVREFTKDVEVKARDAAKEIQPVVAGEKVADGDEFVRLVGDYFDAVLRPLSGNGKPPAANKKPSRLLKAKWDANELGLERVSDLFSFVFMAGKVPPT